jgi:hypothetical protein
MADCISASAVLPRRKVVTLLDKHIGLSAFQWSARLDACPISLRFFA